jgi:hypothetical protein
LKLIDSLTSEVYCGPVATFITAPLPRKASSEPEDSGCRNNGASKVRNTTQITSDVYSLYRSDFSRAFADPEKHRLSGIVASTSSQSGGSKSGASHKSNGTNSSRDELSQRRPVRREVRYHLRLHIKYTTILTYIFIGFSAHESRHQKRKGASKGQSAIFTIFSTEDCTDCYEYCSL